MSLARSGVARLARSCRCMAPVTHVECCLSPQDAKRYDCIAAHPFYDGQSYLADLIDAPGTYFVGCATTGSVVRAHVPSSQALCGVMNSSFEAQE